MSDNDFNPGDGDPEKFIKDPYVRELIDSEFISVDDFTSDEQREAIIQDILTMTFWEKRYNKKLNFDFDELMRFVKPYRRPHIQDQLMHASVQALITMDEGQLRIKPNREIEQAAMDFCGVYFTGYVMPEGAIIINREAFEASVQLHGGLEQFTESVLMDVLSPHQSNKTSH